MRMPIRLSPVNWVARTHIHPRIVGGLILTENAHANLASTPLADCLYLVINHHGRELFAVFMDKILAHFQS